MEKLMKWLDAQKEICFELVRIYLGLGLLAKGIYFFSQTESLARLMQEGGLGWAMNTMIIHYVSMAHATGGLMMVFGMATRLGAAIQIPILVGAVFFVHFKEGVFATSGQNLEFSALVLFLLILVFVYGSGPWSVDYRLAQRKQAA